MSYWGVRTDAMSGTGIGCSYAMSGTEIGFGATRHGQAMRRFGAAVRYARYTIRHVRYAVLRLGRMLLPVCSTEIVYGITTGVQY
eukprot:2281408-Rhodomonas_salina.1